MDSNEKGVSFPHIDKKGGSSTAESRCMLSIDHSPEDMTDKTRMDHTLHLHSNAIQNQLLEVLLEQYEGEL